MIPRWLSYINDLIKEDIYLIAAKKITVTEEKAWLIGELKKIKAKKEILLVAESDGKIIGTSVISLLKGKQSHLGLFGISLSKDYRGTGIGYFMADKIIGLAKNDLKPAPKIIYLGVFDDNRTARELYKKIGFKEVARVPDQFLHKGKLMDEIIMQLYL